MPDIIILISLSCKHYIFLLFMPYRTHYDIIQFLQYLFGVYILLKASIKESLVIAA